MPSIDSYWGSVLAENPVRGRRSGGEDAVLLVESEDVLLVGWPGEASEILVALGEEAIETAGGNDSEAVDRLVSEVLEVVRHVTSHPGQTAGAHVTSEPAA